MFLLKSIAERIIHRPLQFACALVAVAIVTCMALVTASVVTSSSRGQQAYLGCLRDSGANLVAAPARASEEELQELDFPWGERPNGVVIDHMRRISQSETMTAEGDSIYRLQDLGMPIGAAGSLTQQDVEKISAVNGVDRVAGTLCACYSDYTETWSAEALEQSRPTTISINDEDLAALEARLAKDPEYAAYVSEMQTLMSKPEDALTAADHARLFELSDAMAFRKETLFHQWCPDIFPEPTKKTQEAQAEPYSNEEEIIVCGTTPGIGFITQFSVTEGRMLDSSDAGTRVALLRDDYAAQRGLAAGDTITFVDLSYAVIGVGQSELGASAPEVFVPLDTLQKDIAAPDRYNMLFIDLEPAANVKHVRSDIAAAVPGIVVNDATDLSKVLAPSATGLTKIVAQFGTALTVVLAVVAALLLAVLTTSETAKRSREIATLRAIGWSRHKITKLLATENVILVFLGTILGSWGGTLVLHYLAGQAAAQAATLGSASIGTLLQLAGTVPLGSIGAPLTTTVSATVVLWTLSSAVLLAVISTLAVTRAMGRVSPARALSRR